MEFLRKVRESDLGEIAGWNLSATDLQYWAAISNGAENLKLKLAGWLQEPYVNAFVFESDGHLVGYGELWKENEEAEIARLLINPKFRRQGFGRLLTKALLREAKQMNLNVWLRVHPENNAAKSLYSISGFKPASEQQQRDFNANQAVQYFWMRAD